MARQPVRVSAIKTGMAKPVYRVRVELIEIREFLERYPGKIFFFSSLPPLEQVHLYGEATRTNWGEGYALVCCMAEEFGVKELQILWQVHLHGEAARCDSERSAERVVEWEPGRCT